MLFFTSRTSDCRQCLSTFAQLAAIHPNNFYLFITTDYNNNEMHQLDKIPNLLKYNILNDDNTFFRFLQNHSLPMVQFHSEMGKLECETHPLSGVAYGQVCKQPNRTFMDTDTYKSKIRSILKDPKSLLFQLQRSEQRDSNIKTQYQEFEL